MSKNNKQHPKYPFQRVEQRHNNIDTKGLSERKIMEAQATRISIGTFNFLPPKPDTEISNFTLALNKSIQKNELYLKLHQTFDGEWKGKPTHSMELTRSTYIHLSKPIQLQELRRRLKDNFADALPPT
jgi:hypothetical protein